MGLGPLQDKMFNPLAGDKTKDVIHHPDHYTWHPVAECKDITSHFNYNLGTAIAYIWRSGRKGASGEMDLRKAIKHIEFEIERKYTKG